MSRPPARFCGSAGRDLEEVRKSDRWEWQEPIAMPQSLQRYLLVGKKKPLLSRNDIITKGFSQFTSGVFRFLRDFSLATFQ